jgi:Ni,Fe-hydrogenase III large subunit
VTSPRVLVLDAADVDALSPDAWRSAVVDGLRAGHRPVTAFGRVLGDALAITAVLQTPDGALSALRTRLSASVGYHSLTPDFPAMHVFERELHEQHGLRVAGHPWLKPVRYEAGPAAMNDYPFYPVQGKEVHEVAVGPIHAGVIEPGAFRFMCHGEQVHHLEIHLGYQHRGAEALLLRGDARRLAPLVETIAGDSSIAHGWAHCAAIEALAGVRVSADVGVARGVMLELERVAMHLATLAGLAADVGFLQGGTTYGRLRTTAINTSMRLSGSRFGRSAMRPGGLGVRLGGDGLSLAELRRAVALLQVDGAIIDDCFLSSRTVRHRLEGAGTVTREQALAIGLVGPVARACGIPFDQRALADGVYAEHPIAVVTEATGDCLARARVRIEEIRQSLAWIATVTDARPAFAPSHPPVPALGPGRLAISVCEGHRGEVVHALETDAAGALVHYKVQDPSLRNWLGLALAVRENEISDFPICNKSFDLSYCGNDL